MGKNEGFYIDFTWENWVIRKHWGFYLGTWRILLGKWSRLTGDFIEKNEGFYLGRCRFYLEDVDFIVKNMSLYRK